MRLGSSACSASVFNVAGTPPSDANDKLGSTAKGVTGNFVEAGGA